MQIASVAQRGIVMLLVLTRAFRIEDILYSEVEDLMLQGAICLLRSAQRWIAMAYQLQHGYDTFPTVYGNRGSLHLGRSFSFAVLS